MEAPQDKLTFTEILRCLRIITVSALCLRQERSVGNEFNAWAPCTWVVEVSFSLAVHQDVACINFLIAVVKLKQSDLGGGLFHDFRGDDPTWWGRQACLWFLWQWKYLVICSSILGFVSTAGLYLQGLPLRNLLPSAKLYLPKVLQPPKQQYQLGTKCSNAWAFEWEHFTLKSWHCLEKSKGGKEKERNCYD